MKRLIFMLMLVVGTLAIAEQPGLTEYKASKGNYSLVENKNKSNITNGQAAYYEYLYTKNSSEVLIKKKFR